MMQKAIATIRTLFDVRAGLLSGLVMAVIGWIINTVTTKPPDYHGATIAAIKQGGYTLFAGGMLFRIMSRLVARPGRSWLVISIASIVPTILASVVVYLVHSSYGTPSPFWSSMPTLLISATGFPFLATREYRKLNSTSECHTA